MDALLVIGFLALAGWGSYRVVRYILKERYFASEEFQNHKARIASFVAEHNELARYISELRRDGTFELGASDSGSQSHLATFQNTSHWNYRRDRNMANYHAPNVHTCSLQVVRNASRDPLKYVMKYFNIKSDETHLADVEKLGDDIARLQAAVHNLQQREASIAQAISPPAFILKHYVDEFMQHVGVELSPIEVPYPVYVFEYVSAGGNSSQRTTVTFDSPTIDAVIETLSQKIRWKKSAAGQRALMTSTLRNSIKARDNHTCRYCSVSLAVEPHLLLEVDHIIPVSRGGLSTAENLQTLCWKCNRSKSNKVASGGDYPAARTTNPQTLAQSTNESGPTPLTVKCFKCEHWQGVPRALASINCEQCGQTLNTKPGNVDDIIVRAEAQANQAVQRAKSHLDDLNSRASVFGRGGKMDVLVETPRELREVAATLTRIATMMRLIMDEAGVVCEPPAYAQDSDEPTRVIEIIARAESQANAAVWRAESHLDMFTSRKSAFARDASTGFLVEMPRELGEAASTLAEIDMMLRLIMDEAGVPYRRK